MKTNWQTKKLGDITSITKGRKPKDLSNTGNIPYLTARAIRGFEDFEFVSEKQLSECVIVKEDDIVIIMDGSNSGELFSGLKGVLASTMGIIKTEKEFVDSRYLMHFLLTYRDAFTKARTGSAIPHLNKVQFDGLEIPLPSIQEQKRIVKILDEAFEKLEKVKENTEKNLRNSKGLFESYLNNIFSNSRKDWGEMRLEDVCKISSTLIDPKKKEYSEMLHIGAGNMVTKSEVLTDLKTAKVERLISGKFLFDTTMVLYSKIRPYLMKVVRPKFDGLCSADIYPLTPLEKLITRDFLFYLLLSKDFTDYAINGSARAGMPKVNREHLFGYTFYLPSITEQKQIVKKLDQLSEKTQKLEVLYKQKLENIKELKKSILQKAFSGGL